MPPDITSRQHRVVRAFKAAAQREGDLALLDGWHLLHDAFAANLEITTVAVSIVPDSARDRTLLERLARAGEVVTVSTAVMDAVSPARTPSGVVALARPRHVDMHDLLTPVPPLVLVGVDVQDPGNAGAMIRSAEAGGASGVVLAGASADPWGWKALRAAMGSTFRIPVRRESDTLALLQALQHAKLTRMAAVPRGAAPMASTELRRPVALLLGGEGAGLDRTILERCDEHVSIPMSGGVESLNVAVAAALLVYEASRQRDIHQVGHSPFSN
jgi:RNA methyltransferase, TrmH family